MFLTATVLLASALSVAELPSPAANGSAEPFLATTKDGAILSWLEPVTGTDRTALRVSRYRAGSWSSPKTVVERGDLLANWADFPAVVEDAKGVLFAQWLQKSGTHTYDISMSTSRDDGRSWLAPFPLNRDGRKSEHGFVSLSPLPDGGVAAAWLDGRNMKEGTEEGDMTLRYAAIDTGGHIRDEVELDARTCECCATGMAIAGRTPVIAYRDRSVDEVRDIAVVRPGSKSQLLHADGWKINGCPVNGPQVAASANSVAIAWFTAAAGRPLVQAKFSSDAGKTFGAPIAVSTGQPVGRVDIVLLDAQTALVSWIEQTTAAAEIRGRIVRQHGDSSPAIRLADSAAARSAGFPRMARAGRDVLIAWTDTANAKRVRVARIHAE